MHEASISASLVEIALNHAGENSMTTVHKLLVHIGRLHHVVPDVLKSHFDIMKMEYTILENSQLEIQRLDVLVQCKKCQKQSNLEDVIFLCPQCGSPSIEILQGNEMHLITIEGENRDSQD